jgi:glycosyltransferase involved in cell wall biosynthesis
VEHREQRDRSNSTMLQNPSTHSQHLPVTEPLRILFHVARYWPAVAGAALHSRELIKYLSLYYSIGVVRHTADEPFTKEIAFANNPTLTLHDGTTPIYQLGPHHWLRRPLKYLGHHYFQSRWQRVFYDRLLRISVEASIDRIADQYDIIHSVYTGMTSSVMAAQAIAHRQGKPFVLTPLPHIEDESKRASTTLRRMYRQADALLAMTYFERDWLIQQGVNPERVHVCPVGPLVAPDANPSAFRDKYQLGNAPIVLFIARQVVYKGYRQLCQASERVWQHHPDTRFIFIGPPTEEANRFFAQYPDPRILNLREVTLDDKTSAIAACNVLCVPSTEESLGAIYLEAWLYAKPVIAAQIPVMRSVIAHEQDGLILPQTPEAIASGLIALLDNPAWGEQMGNHGYHKVRSEYEWNILSAKVQRIYHHLLTS